MANVNARYRVVEDGAYVMPGTCLTCGRSGSSDERGMIDTGVDQDFYGVVYVCSYCVLEMSEQYGAASPATQLHNLAASEERDRLFAEARERLAKAEGILDGLGALHLLDINPDNISVGMLLGENPDEEEATESVGSAPTVAESGETAQSPTDESPAGEGPDDFFDTDESDDPFNI